VAIQDQGQGQLQEFAGILKRHSRKIVLPALLFLALGIAVARILPRKYTAKTGIELRESTLPFTGEGLDVKTLQRDISSTSWQIKQVERVTRVVEKLEWPDYTALSTPKKHEYLRNVIENITPGSGTSLAKNGQGSSLIEFQYTDSDPQRAEQFLNRLREAYISEVMERFRNDAQKALDVIANQRKLAEKAYLQADQEAADVKKRNQVSATQQAPGGGRQRDEDPVFTHLTAVQRQRDDSGAAITALQATVTTLKEQFAETPREIPRDQLKEGVSYDTEIASLEDEITLQRERQKGIRPPHSTYIDAESKIEEAQEKIQALKDRATKPQTDLGMVHNPRRDELDIEIKKQDLELRKQIAIKAKLEEDLQRLGEEQAARTDVFREIQRLDQLASIAAEAFKNASSQYDHQKRFVDLVNTGWANPFEITEYARTPQQPTSPNQPLVIAAALLLGLSVGLISAFTTEFGHGAFRGVADVSRALSVPVLAIVNRITTQREEARARSRRLAVTGATLALVGAILWVTWAFENRPRLLGSHLTQTIENFREVFR
jgi:capsular polysaccharide biosynthesis protein